MRGNAFDWTIAVLAGVGAFIVIVILAYGIGAALATPCGTARGEITGQVVTEEGTYQCRDGEVVVR